MINVQSKNLILLTGAGFTKNFGGFLAEEMWAHIFNNPNIQQSPYLRTLLQANFDFESVYSEVIDNPRTSSEDKERMKRAVFEAYKQLDDAIKGWVFNSDNPYPVNWYGVSSLIQLFVGSGNEKGFFFTLNQDIFMERRSQYHSPGSPRFPNEFYGMGGRDLKPEEFVTLQGTGVEKKAETDMNSYAGLIYIKLHGSYGWRSSNGSNQLVIGKNKAGLINEEPLLKWYFDLLESIIKQGGKKILIIGYGFQDMHINKILVDGVQNHGLKIFILTTQSPASLRDRIQHGHYYAMPIFEGISGYFPHLLKEVFPANQDRTVLFQNIKDALLKN